MADIIYGDKYEQAATCKERKEVEVQCDNHIGRIQCDWKENGKLINHHKDKDICNKITASWKKGAGVCGVVAKLCRSVIELEALLKV